MQITGFLCTPLGPCVMYLYKRSTRHVNYAHVLTWVIQDILNEPEEIQSLKGNMIPRRLSVDYISFSAHVDYAQNSEFIEQVKAQHVVSIRNAPDQ